MTAPSSENQGGLSLIIGPIMLGIRLMEIIEEAEAPMEETEVTGSKIVKGTAAGTEVEGGGTTTTTGTSGMEETIIREGLMMASEEIAAGGANSEEVIEAAADSAEIEVEAQALFVGDEGVQAGVVVDIKEIREITIKTMEANNGETKKSLQIRKIMMGALSKEAGALLLRRSSKLQS